MELRGYQRSGWDHELDLVGFFSQIVVPNKVAKSCEKFKKAI